MVRWKCIAFRKKVAYKLYVCQVWRDLKASNACNMLMKVHAEVVLTSLQSECSLVHFWRAGLTPGRWGQTPETCCLHSCINRWHGETDTARWDEMRQDYFNKQIRNKDAHTHTNLPAYWCVWLEGVVLASVLGLYFFLCSLAAVFASTTR